jgi:hypothetical protein
VLCHLQVHAEATESCAGLQDGVGSTPSRNAEFRGSFHSFSPGLPAGVLRCLDGGHGGRPVPADALHALAGHLPPYDTYVSVSDSDDGFDDFLDVDGWGFGST